MADDLSEKTGALGPAFLLAEQQYSDKLPALYSLLYRQYRSRAVGCDYSETAVPLALAILLAQAAAEQFEESASNLEAIGNLNGRLCFRLSELLTLLPEESAHNLANLCGNPDYLTKLPGFCALSNEVLAESYFCYWQEEEPAFCLARMARLQRSLWSFLQYRNIPTESSNLLEQPELLSQTLNEMDGSQLPGDRLPQSHELLADCLGKLCRERLLLVAGGPGSGKTTLLASLLKILQRAEQKAQRKLELALCAPTARAAQRMRQSLPDLEAMTLHKLLGLGWASAELYRPATRHSQNYHSAKGLKLRRLDLLVLDEASMLDSEMAYRLFSRLQPQTRVILIGDPEQLPPVGLGAFWKELLASPEKNSRLANCLVTLQGSYRSVAEIQKLAQNVRQGQKLDALLGGGNNQAICWQPLESGPELLSYLWQNWCPPVWGAEPAIELYFQWLQDYTVLSPLHRGPGGAYSISEQLLQHGQQQRGTRQGFFHGCPIQITRNNYQLGLFNGDRGFCFQRDRQFYGVFAAKYSEAKYRWLPIAQLDNCEASFVQTIHKSQGSEYRNVCILLPEVIKSWSQPLLYTAITRARQHLCFVGSEAAMKGVSLGRQAKPLRLLAQFVARKID